MLGYLYILYLMKNAGTYVVNVFWGLDILANVLTGGKRETISARAAKYKDRNKIASTVCDILDKIDPDHCKDSFTWWSKRE